MPDKDILIGIVGVLLSVDQCSHQEWNSKCCLRTTYHKDITVVCTNLVFICCMIREIQLLFTIFIFIGIIRIAKCIGVQVSKYHGD